MPYAITQTCCADAACVSVCPVNCIHPAPGEPGFGTSEILHIDARSCIDCGACADACPVNAIFPTDRLSEKDGIYADINAHYYEERGVEPSRGVGLIGNGAKPHQQDKYPTIPQDTKLHHIAVVGTGPSAGYIVGALLERTEARITVIDKLPTPGGLVRAGVAPDHPGTKGVLQTFDIHYRHPRVTMATNIEVGTTVTAAELSAHFDAVFYATGASGSRSLGIPGEDLQGSTSATELVSWYNAVPGHDAFPLSPVVEGPGRTVVIGTGNVALDIGRILASSPEVLATTDIADHALAALNQRDFRDVVLLGRKDYAAAAFTEAEFRALQYREDIDVRVVNNQEPLPADLTLPPASHAKPRITLLFGASPTEILGEDYVTGIRITRPEGEHVLPAGLVVRSIGHQVTAIPGVPFDETRHVLPTENSRVLGAPLGTYAAGWAKRGPSGGIGANKRCALDAVDAFLEDAVAQKLPAKHKGKAFNALLIKRRAEVINHRGVAAIDRAERERGKAQGRPRVKFVSLPEMINTAKRAGRPRLPL